jgi:hypothetical protein
MPNTIAAAETAQSNIVFSRMLPALCIIRSGIKSVTIHIGIKMAESVAGHRSGV